MEARRPEGIILRELPDKIGQLVDTSVPAGRLARVESIVAVTILHSLVVKLADDYDGQLPFLLKFLQDRLDLLKDTKLLGRHYSGSAINKACQMLANTLQCEDTEVLKFFRQLSFDVENPLSVDEEEERAFRFLAKHISQKTDQGYISNILKSADNELWRYFVTEIVYYFESREQFFSFVANQLERGVWEEALGLMHFLPVCDQVLSKDFSVLASRYEQDLLEAKQVNKFSQYKDKREAEFKKQVLGTAKFHFERLVNAARYSVIDSRQYDQEKTRAFCFFLAYVYEKVRASEHTYKSNVTWGFSKLTLGMFNDALGVQDKNKKMSACHVFRRYITDSDKHDNLSAFLEGIHEGHHLAALTEKYTLTNTETQLAWLVRFYQDEMQRAEKMYPREEKPAAFSAAGAKH